MSPKLSADVYTCPARLPGLEAIAWPAFAYLVRYLYTDAPRNPLDARVSLTQAFIHAPPKPLHTAGDTWACVYGSAWGRTCLALLEVVRPGDMDAAHAVLAARLSDAPRWAALAATWLYQGLYLQADVSPPSARPQRERDVERHRFGFEGAR